MPGTMDMNLAFFELLRNFYESNKGKIRNHYRAITLKYLDYNDVKKNDNAYLRKPQFEALEMYVFVKEFMDNKQMYQIFDEWCNKKSKFSEEGWYTIQNTGISGQMGFFEAYSSKQYHSYFNEIRKFAESYPNYIFALTMGLGKTILMATCIYYEFLLASKWPKDEKYCHNVLVFAPDKTVLQSLKEIITFEKSKVVPEEYIKVLDSNIKIHFLDETGTTLNTLDDSMFNIIISNTQKIILKKQHKEQSAVDQLFSWQIKGQTALDEAMEALGEIKNDNDLMSNQRFEKLKRLKQIGIYVDEAHHMFGADLEKALHNNASPTSLRTTINELAEELDKKGSRVIACYNYTGTPYVNNKVLPEVVYAYGLSDAIRNNYLKDTDIIGYENVKSAEFLKNVIFDFWNKYGENEYEGLMPKLAVFGADIDEVDKKIRPIVEDALRDLNISINKILVNVGDEKITKAEDIRDFNNLDIKDTKGCEKQFILLVNKGREGWNCRSLFGVAMFRSPKSKVFVLQATMRCLRKITDEQQTATVYLSKENMDILDSELQQNFRVGIDDLKNKDNKPKPKRKVRVTEPPTKIKMKRMRHNHTLEKKEYRKPITFGLFEYATEKYDAKLYVKEGLANAMTVKEHDANYMIEGIAFTPITLVAEIAKYFVEIKCTTISKILRESKEGIDVIVSFINEHNELLYDKIIPEIFNIFYEVHSKVVTENNEVILLKKPKDGGYYEFSGSNELTVTEDSKDTIIQANKGKSFHADTYVFDSKPELEFFLQSLKSKNVAKVYFTGMFTANQTDFYVPYIDPESNRLRKYYPDFLTRMLDGTYRIIEVKGDNKLEDEVVKAKERAAKEIAVESSMTYEMLPGSKIMSETVI